MTSTQLERARRLLCALQDHIRDTVIAARAQSTGNLAQIAAVTAADTIYQIDRVSEEAVCAWFEAHWPRAWPVELVMEGLEDEAALTFPRGTPVAKTVCKCILDPIDGTRGIMYDKRSAWILAGLAPQRGHRTNLSDIVVAAMTELPTSKQWRADQLSAVRGRGLRAEQVNVLTGERTRFTPQPSRATDCKHGFAAFARFFPEGKALISQIEETLWAELYGINQGASPLIFDDQYICSGGQLYELIVGHDRLICDLRPLAFAHLGLRSELTCHPYDVCTALLLAEAGGIVETPAGRPLRAPLDTTTPVSWIGYANTTLARQIRPILRRVLRQHLG
ncbi:MAG: inositol monophosphatase [Opitutae bacterium]|nr:inositol monophosphatase [Opitutae bacterium]